MKRMALPLAVALATLVTTIVLTAGMWHGKLAVPIIYDDVNYLLRGLDIYDLFWRSSSVWDFLVKWPTLDMHSPVADLQAFMGFFLFGNSIVGPYILSAIYLALFLWMTLRVFERHPVHLRLAVCLLVLTTPFVLYVVSNLKSDWVGGLFFMLATMCALNLTPFETIRTRILWTIGLGSAAILSKPTGFHIPLILCGTLFLGFVLQFAAAGNDGPGERSVESVTFRWRSWLSLAPFLLIAVGIAAVVSLFMWGRLGGTLDYILWQMNPESGYFAEAKSLTERLLERLPASVWMKHVWGVSFYWFAMVAIVGNVGLFWRSDQSEKLRSACFFLVVVVTYAATVLNPFANLSFASLFFFSALGYTIYMLSVLADWLPNRHVVVLSLLIALSTLAGYPPKQTVNRSPEWGRIEQLNHVFQQLVAEINNYPVYSVLATGLDNGPITNNSLHLHAELQRLPGRPKQRLEWLWPGQKYDEERFRERLSKTDMYIGVDRQQHQRLSYAWKANYPYGSPLRIAESNPEFVELARYALGEATYFVFIRASRMTADGN